MKKAKPVIDTTVEHSFMMAGYYFTLGIMEITNAMWMAKQDKDVIDDINRKYDELWSVYKEAYEKAAKGVTCDEA